ncbi:uncharacterized protein LOC107364820 isoform X1 [Tetranychus urticae]|uniref:Uncharacterized protein n=1 Tax=Tetranychus urticae TaxID=32264 RepID=T1KJN1_TETUR|nr:uncharacterized protein LOC107364820 isoform X1 [Tetranychus urticae]
MSSPGPSEDQSYNSVQPKEDKDLINQQLYQLVQTANIDMDYRVFCVVVDLLRAGICPEALFVFFSNIYPHTRVGRKLATAKKNRRSKPSQCENQVGTNKEGELL